MTAEQQTFVQNFKAAPSKVDKPRKLALRHVEGRGSSKHKNGARRADVKPETLTIRLNEFPTHFLKITACQLFCEACSRNLDQCKQCRFQLVCCVVSYYDTGAYHKDAGKASWFVNRSRTPRMHYRVHQYKGIVSAESGGKEPAGFALVSEKVQVVRAEFLVDRKDDKGKDTLLTVTCRIGGRQTVQNYQHSPTCCVQCSPTHPTPVPPSVSLASSIQLSMLIRVDLTLTTCSYRCSHSLTVESSTLLACLPRSER
jgi:hypothetical protein